MSGERAKRRVIPRWLNPNRHARRVLDGLDPGIRRAVEVLREAGVHTYESCEGGEGHSFRNPTVKFYGTVGEGWRALAVCQDLGLPVRSMERTWDIDDGEPSGPYWKIVFRSRFD